MRTTTYGRVVPLVHRRDGTVTGFIVRVTLREDDVTAFDDVPIEVGAPYRPVASWTEDAIKALVAEAMAKEGLARKKLDMLTARLDQRLGVAEAPALPMEWTA